MLKIPNVVVICAVFVLAWPAWGAEYRLGVNSNHSGSNSIPTVVTEEPHSLFEETHQRHGELYGIDTWTHGVAHAAVSAGGVSASTGMAMHHPRRNISAYSTATLEDEVVISHPTLNGTLGTVEMALAYYAKGSVKGEAGIHGQYSARFGWIDSAISPYLGDAQVPVLSGTFRFGDPFDARLGVWSQSAAAMDSDVVLATVGLGLAFAGIGSIRDAEGNLVSFVVADTTSPLTVSSLVGEHATVSSALGIDYTVAQEIPDIVLLPEPTTGAIAALACLAMLSRHRRQTNA